MSTPETPVHRLLYLAKLLLGPAVSVLGCALLYRASKDAFVVGTALTVVAYVMAAICVDAAIRLKLLVFAWAPWFLTWLGLRFLWRSLTNLVRWVKTGQ